VSLTVLVETLRRKPYDLVSTDIFDTVLLRDHTIGAQRLAEVCRRVGPLLGVDSDVLTRLRWSLHSSAYRAVAIERPWGEASLAAICTTMAQALGRDDYAAQLLRQAEVDVEITHLRPNRRLLHLLDQLADSGLRVVGVSDTYLGQDDLRRILDSVVGRHPLVAVYSSADLGLTKQAGAVYAAVADREAVAADRILHIGDSHQVDVLMARQASWNAVHLPRNAMGRARKTVGKILAVPVKVRSWQ
jgi:FMN phosphatase YigB (HAD superfamily)